MWGTVRPPYLPQQLERCRQLREARLRELLARNGLTDERVEEFLAAAEPHVRRSAA